MKSVYRNKTAGKLGDDVLVQGALSPHFQDFVASEIVHKYFILSLDHTCTVLPPCESGVNITYSSRGEFMA